MMNVYTEDYDIIPNIERDQTKQIMGMLSDVKMLGGEKVIHFTKGKYYFELKNSVAKSYAISNTTSVKEHPSQLRHIAILIEEINDLTIDGGGASFIFRETLTELVINKCNNIRIKNCSFEYLHPTVLEFGVVNTGTGYLDIVMDEANKHLFLNKSWRTKQLCVKYNNASQKMTRVFPIQKLFYHQKQINDDILRVYTWYLPLAFIVRKDDVYQIRNSIRNEVGIFIRQSKNINVEKCNIDYSHGLGIISQNSSNLTFNYLTFRPKPNRSCGCFADFMHFSGCRGKIIISNSKFKGAHDDCINIHSTYLQVIKQIDKYALVIRYRHPQTYGFAPYAVGDEVALVDSFSLACYHRNRVEGCQKLSDDTYVLKVENILPETLKKSTVSQNLSEQSEVVIENNHFASIPTRAILLTNGKKAIIRSNVFHQISMSAISISGDARSWYESGPVSDVLIENNIFTNCGSPIIQIEPQVKKSTQPVHKNIKILNNNCETTKTDIEIFAKLVDGLYIQGDKNIKTKLQNCKNIKFQGGGRDE